MVAVGRSIDQLVPSYPMGLVYLRYAGDDIHEPSTVAHLENNAIRAAVARVLESSQGAHRRDVGGTLTADAGDRGMDFTTAGRRRAEESRRPSRSYDALCGRLSKTAFGPRRRRKTMRHVPDTDLTQAATSSSPA